MAENAPDTQHPHNAYDDQTYRQNREAALGIIPKSNILSAINRNSGVVFNALITTAVAAIVAGIFHIPLWGTIALVGGALVAAGVSAYAGYKDEQLSKTVGLGFSEANEVAKARLNGRELAKAIDETMGEEVRDVRQKTEQTQLAVADLQQKMASWQDRTSVKDEIPHRRP